MLRDRHCPARPRASGVPRGMHCLHPLHHHRLVCSPLGRAARILIRAGGEANCEPSSRGGSRPSGVRGRGSAVVG